MRNAFVKHRVFIYNTFVTCMPWKKCRRQFRNKNPALINVMSKKVFK